jgi:hypothetical protein
MTVSADWHDFATMIGGASAALTGLLFVAVSLNASRIAGHAGLRASAGQTLVMFITPLVTMAALLTPRQPDRVLGAEFIAIGLLAGLVLAVNDRVKRGLADEDLRLIAIFNRPAPNAITMLLVMASGGSWLPGRALACTCCCPRRSSRSSAACSMPGSSCSHHRKAGCREERARTCVGAALRWPIGKPTERSRQETKGAATSAAAGARRSCSRSPADRGARARTPTSRSGS